MARENRDQRQTEPAFVWRSERGWLLSAPIWLPEVGKDRVVKKMRTSFGRWLPWVDERVFTPEIKGLGYQAVYPGGMDREATEDGESIPGVPLFEALTQMVAGYVYLSDKSRKGVTDFDRLMRCVDFYRGGAFKGISQALEMSCRLHYYGQWVEEGGVGDDRRYIIDKVIRLVSRALFEGEMSEIRRIYDESKEGHPQNLATFDQVEQASWLSLGSRREESWWIDRVIGLLGVSSYDRGSESIVIRPIGQKMGKLTGKTLLSAAMIVFGRNAGVRQELAMTKRAVDDFFGLVEVHEFVHFFTVKRWEQKKETLGEWAGGLLRGFGS